MLFSQMPIGIGVARKTLRVLKKHINMVVKSGYLWL